MWDRYCIPLTGDHLPNNVDYGNANSVRDFRRPPRLLLELLDQHLGLSVHGVHQLRLAHAQVPQLSQCEAAVVVPREAVAADQSCTERGELINVTES